MSDPLPDDIPITLKEACEVKLNSDEQRILQFLADESSEDFGYFNFKALSRETGFDRKRVRRACRSLTRKHLAKFGSGLCTEDGDFAGSGYAASLAGIEFMYGPR